MEQKKTGVDIIADERRSQMEDYGWSVEHDIEVNQNGELALAAIAYAKPNKSGGVEPEFPWHEDWWKPSPDDRIKELAKAGALIAAEIDRLLAL